MKNHQIKPERQENLDYDLVYYEKTIVSIRDILNLLRSEEDDEDPDYAELLRIKEKAGRGADDVKEEQERVENPIAEY